MSKGFQYLISIIVQGYSNKDNVVLAQNKSRIRKEDPYINTQIQPFQMLCPLLRKVDRLRPPQLFSVQGLAEYTTF